jgi:hypothetical protein
MLIPTSASASGRRIAPGGRGKKNRHASDSFAAVLKNADVPESTARRWQTTRQISPIQVAPDGGFTKKVASFAQQLTAGEAHAIQQALLPDRTRAGEAAPEGRWSIWWQKSRTRTDIR